MRQFDFYEFAGILVPGTIVLAALYLAFPSSHALLGTDGLSIGEFGLAVILAYAAGHIVQGFGNLLEKAWWRPWGGMPTDWVGAGKGDLISSDQAAALAHSLRVMLGKPDFEMRPGTRPAGWYGTTRQIYAAVAKAGQAGRIDTFNGNYGLCRGLAAALCMALVIGVAQTGLCHWPLMLCLLGGVAMCVYRMHRFGVHYARELFVQFLASRTPSDSPSRREGE